MESWKETLADTMTAWDYRTEKSLWSDNEYYIRVACTSASVTDTCRKTMDANMKKLCSDFKGFKAVDASHFDIKVGSSQAQTQLHSNLDNVVTEVEAYRKKTGEKSGNDRENEIKRRNYTILAVAVALVTIIIWLLWKRK